MRTEHSQKKKKKPQGLALTLLLIELIQGMARAGYVGKI